MRAILVAFDTKKWIQQFNYDRMTFEQAMTQFFFTFQKRPSPHLVLASLDFMTIEIFVDGSGEIQTESVGEIWGQRRDLGRRNGWVGKSCKNIKLDLRLICPDGVAELRSIDKSHWSLAHKRSCKKTIVTSFAIKPLGNFIFGLWNLWCYLWMMII